MNQSPLQKALRKLEDVSFSELITCNKVLDYKDVERILQEMEIDMLKEFEEKEKNKIHY